jgi:predicted RNase H-like HicB family nuclease
LNSFTARIKEASVDRQSRTPEEYLKMPYARVLTPDHETGTYTAEILEFPGCIAQGDTPEEAYERLESAAAGWIEAALDMGQEIPEPSDPYSYSGRIALRLPRSLHRRAAQMAERDGTSLNQFLVSAIAERVGAGSLYGQMAQWLERWATQSAMSSTWTQVDTVARGMGQVRPDLLLRVGDAIIPVQTKVVARKSTADKPSESFAMYGTRE